MIAYFIQKDADESVMMLIALTLWTARPRQKCCIGLASSAFWHLYSVRVRVRVRVKVKVKLWLRLRFRVPCGSTYQIDCRRILK